MLQYVFEALYTPHLVQKYKKWHDGRCVYFSATKKLVLLDDEGHIVAERFWSGDGVPDAGTTLELDRYLVELEALLRTVERPAADAQPGRSPRRAPRALARPSSAARGRPLSDVLLDASMQIKPLGSGPIERRAKRVKADKFGGLQPALLGNADAPAAPKPEPDAKLWHTNSVQVDEAALARAQARSSTTAAGGHPLVKRELAEIEQDQSQSNAEASRVWETADLAYESVRDNAAHDDSALFVDDDTHLPPNVDGFDVDALVTAGFDLYGIDANEADDATHLPPSVDGFNADAPAADGFDVYEIDANEADVTALEQAAPRLTSNEMHELNSGAEQDSDALFSDTDVEVLDISDVPRTRRSLFEDMPAECPTTGPWTKEAYLLFSWHPPPATIIKQEAP